MQGRVGIRFAGLLCTPIMAAPALAQSVDAESDADQIVVYGRGLEAIGVAQSGSQGTVGYADFQDVPISRTGELVENVPGVIATQHSGSGKANQYFLRGFNLDHGTDFAGFVDGAPINMRTHGHGQGYLDFNFVIPKRSNASTTARGRILPMWAISRQRERSLSPLLTRSIRLPSWKRAHSASCVAWLVAART